ncbi:MAG: glycosyltransferase family 39 protein [Anaerolineae bacterium]
MTPSAATSPVPRPGAAPRRPSTRRAAVAAVVVLALALRWWGLRFGLPATYHPDEHQYVDAAIAAVGGVWNPGRFNNPSLLKYALAAAYGVWYALGRLAGAWPSVDAWQRATAADPTAAYALARALVGVLGAATCAVVAAIGRRLRGETTGMLAAALLAVAFLHVRDSHYAVNDVPAALLTTLAVAIALRVRAEGRGRDLVVGAVVAGLATATKYTALVAVLPLAIGWLAAGWSDADRPPAAVAGGPGAGTLGRRLRHAGRRLATGPVALAAVAFVAAFLAAVPYAVLDRPAFVADVALLATRGREGFKGLRIDAAPGWIFYLKSLGWGLGWPLLAAAIVGLGLALRRRRADDAIVAVVPLVLWGYLGGQLNMFARFMLPAVPLLCVFAADAVMAVGDRVRKGITGWGSGRCSCSAPTRRGGLGRSRRSSWRCRRSPPPSATTSCWAAPTRGRWRGRGSRTTCRPGRGSSCSPAARSWTAWASTSSRWARSICRSGAWTTGSPTPRTTGAARPGW